MSQLGRGGGGVGGSVFPLTSWRKRLRACWSQRATVFAHHSFFALSLFVCMLKARVASREGTASTYFLVFAVREEKRRRTIQTC